MSIKRRLVLAAVTVTLTVCSNRALSQVAPVAPSTTVWKFLGIPQGVNQVYGASVNRRGNIAERCSARQASIVSRTPRVTAPTAGTLATTERPSSRRTSQATIETNSVAVAPTGGNRQLRLVPIQPDDLASFQQGQHLSVSDHMNHRVGNISHVDLASHVNQLGPVIVSDVDRQKQRPQAAAPTQRTKPVHGVVRRVSHDNQTVAMSFSHGWKPEIGSWVLVYHEYLLERACLGALEVIGTNGKYVVARTTGDVNLNDLTKGDEVVSR